MHHLADSNGGCCWKWYVLYCDMALYRKVAPIIRWLFHYWQQDTLSVSLYVFLFLSGVGYTHNLKIDNAAYSVHFMTHLLCHSFTKPSFVAGGPSKRTLPIFSFYWCYFYFEMTRLWIKLLQERQKIVQKKEKKMVVNEHFMVLLNNNFSNHVIGKWRENACFQSNYCVLWMHLSKFYLPKSFH